MKIVSTCPLCEERALHLIGKEDYQMQQCIGCGYVTFEKFKLHGKSLENNEGYNSLTGDMKHWVKIDNDRIWTPSIFTLPTGMLYPMDDKSKNMKWAYSKMVDIPEDEQENYPNGQGGFYTRKYDVKNPKIYDEFVFALSQLNEDAKNENKL